MHHPVADMGREYLPALRYKSDTPGEGVSPFPEVIVKPSRFKFFIDSIEDSGVGCFLVLHAIPYRLRKHIEKKVELGRSCGLKFGESENVVRVVHVVVVHIAIVEVDVASIPTVENAFSAVGK